MLAYNELFSLGTNFPIWLTLTFSRNFPDLEIHDLNNWKTQVNDISPVYMFVHVRLDSSNRWGACKLGQYSWSISSSCARSIIVLCGWILYCTGCLLLQYKHPGLPLISVLAAIIVDWRVMLLTGALGFSIDYIYPYKGIYNLWIRQPRHF